MSVIIFGFWNVPIVRNFINPLKLFTIGWHELCHVFAVRFVMYLYLGTALLWLTVSHTGNIVWWPSIEDNYRPPRWRGDDRGGWSPDLHTMLRIYWISFVRWCFCPSRMGHARRENNELRPRNRTHYASCFGKGQTVSTAYHSFPIYSHDEGRYYSRHFMKRC